MQKTLVPHRKPTPIKQHWLVKGPLKPRQIATSLTGQSYYVTLTRSLRRIPDAALKHLLAARRARIAARVVITAIKLLIVGALIGVAIPLVVSRLLPLVQR